MESNYCYESVTKLVADASKRFGDQFVVNSDKAKSLSDICKIIEKMISEFECESFDVNIHDVTKKLTICLVCDEFIFQSGCGHPFFSLIKMLSSFSFSKSKDDSLQLELNIDGLWVERL